MDEGSERFWRSVPERPSEACWPWAGKIDRDGYGRHGRARAHRFAYELLVGLIPDGLVIDHLCRVRNCVNPDHLEAVTNAENRRRGRGFPHPAKVIYCGNGHLWSENTHIRPNGQRECRSCVRERMRRFQKRKRENRAA